MELKEYKLTENTTSDGKDNKQFTLDDYIGKIQYGAWQDFVIEGRKAKQSGDTELYKKIKNQAVFITPTGTFEAGKSKIKDNMTANGLVVIDVDTELTKEQEHSLYNDRYTYVIHRSFGGDGFCIFVRIDPLLIDNAYHAVSKYYLEQYGIVTDKSCSNSNRGRFASYDPDVHVNPKAPLFKVKIEKKDKEPTNTFFVFTDSDFDNILTQIRDKNVDLCQQDYYRYVRIGMALANHFGESGRDHFHYICSFGEKYNQRHTDRDYNGFVKSNIGKTTIGTFYYYCKDAGINIYTDRTKDIINRVKVSKSQGTPTVQSVVDNLKAANNIDANEQDLKLIQQLIDSKIDFSHNANSDLTEIEQLANFIVDAYTPSIDEITHTKYVNGQLYSDRFLEDIYLTCQKTMSFNVNKADVKSILKSSYVKRTNILKDFVRDNAELTPDGFIEQYAMLIHPQSEYNVWAFRKWIVGAMHNWFCDFEDREASPLTMVLTGKDHGVGKTSFFRNLLPKELRQYLIQSKLSIKDKDSILRMGKSLIILDDEFGGKAFKDDKEFKDISDQTHITLRVAYGEEDTTFKRRASLAGTSNELDVLKDVTGNRRILPILVKATDYERMVSFDSASLIMEAYNLYKSGFEWRIFSEEEKQYIKDNTNQNQVILPMEELFFMYFSLERNHIHSVETIMNQGEVLQFLNINSGMKPSKFEVSEVFKKNNMEYKNYNGKKGVRVFMAGNHVKPEIAPF